MTFDEYCNDNNLYLNKEEFKEFILNEKELDVDDDVPDMEEEQFDELWDKFDEESEDDDEDDEEEDDF